MANIIHIAGPLVGSVQKCTRCKTRIDSNRTWGYLAGKPTGWQEGVEVYRSRFGSSAGGSGIKNKSEYRPCGKQSPVHSDELTGREYMNYLNELDREEFERERKAGI